MLLTTDVERELRLGEPLHDVVVDLERLPFALAQILEQRAAARQRREAAAEQEVPHGDAGGEHVPRARVPRAERVAHRHRVAVVDVERRQQQVHGVAAVVRRRREEDRRRL